jgi:high affinity sulfate transporter 1
VTHGAAAVQPEGGHSRVVPGWIRGYRRAWLSRDVVAGIVVWSVVVPQAVAYAQIAGLPPQAGLVAAPGALLAYAVLGSSRTLVVGATTATAAVSASAVGAVAQGDPSRFAALSATFALIVAVVFAGAGLLHLGGVIDLISKPVMTGFLFGLGLTIAVGQVPKLLGIAGGDGNFFQKAWAELNQLDDISWSTFAVGAASVVLLIACRRLLPGVPSTLAVLGLAIAVSTGFDLSSHGVAVVGKLPASFPHFAWPDFNRSDVVHLLAPAFGVILLSTEGLGVARSLATRDGYNIDANRELIAVGGSNALAGLSQGFVQAGGSSQTMAAQNVGGKSQLASVIAAALTLLTGAFLYPLFKNLPEATLGAIIIVAVSGLWRVDELRRYARIRQSALVFALIALFGVLAFNVLPGLIIAAGLSLVSVIQRLSRPQLRLLGRDPTTGAWERLESRQELAAEPGYLVARIAAPLFYANAVAVKEGLLAAARGAAPPVTVVVLDLSESSDLDVEAADVLSELHQTLANEHVELRLASVRERAHAILTRSGLAARIRIEPSLDEAARPVMIGAGRRSSMSSEEGP